MVKPSKRASEMQRVVEEFGASGLTRREFSRQRGIAKAREKSLAY